MFDLYLGSDNERLSTAMNQLWPLAFGRIEQAAELCLRIGCPP
jgi:hypothetical protein